MEGKRKDKPDWIQQWIQQWMPEAKCRPGDPPREGCGQKKELRVFISSHPTQDHSALWATVLKAPHHGTVYFPKGKGTAASPAAKDGLFRFLRLFSYILSRRTREMVFQ